jgi:putative SOS response-associated peptidase YedK
MINARAETLAEKPAFRDAFARRRCIVPADGFYEWRAGQPFHIVMRDRAPMAFAGLWETWRDPAAPPDAGLLRTCTIVTTSANDAIRPFHDRMPVVLSGEHWAEWLDRENRDTAALSSLLVPADAGRFEVVAVAPLVNSVRNNGPELVEPCSG